LPKEQLLFEPVGRNTAPAIALLCLQLQRKGLQEAVVGVFPADHLIENEQAFHQALAVAYKTAQTGRIVTLGINPTYPATGYGYIQTGPEPISGKAESSTFAVSSFHEKPSLEKAQEFINRGHFFWNAGIFVFRTKDMIHAFQKWQPKMWEQINGINPDLSNIEGIYSSIENISLDYAIMERLESSELACIPCEMGWSDVGSWDAIADLMQNSTDNTVSVRAEKNFIFGDHNKKYALIDVQDLIVVDTSDALLISQRGSTQAVKEAYEQVKDKWPKLVSEHPYEYRPWGQFEILRDCDHFKSKVIEVSPGEQLSYQSHTKREEHWIITQGSGEVILNDSTLPVQAGSYVKIPQGAKHRMRNSGTVKLQFVEVQLGSYFGEDDITRYQDDYLRK
jgi:mannose-1-phosphate guanylyltransferase/mannose-1-phosphate guanylyltransferase/mannose-6-phosphate isomerase